MLVILRPEFASISASFCNDIDQLKDLADNEELSHDAMISHTHFLAFLTVLLHLSLIDDKSITRIEATTT